MQRTSQRLPPRALFSPDASEGDFQQAQRRLAIANGYLYYHTKDSRRSDKGWPDTAIIHRNGGILHLWENKDATGTATKEQEEWLYALRRVTSVDAHLYRPRDWPAIVRALTGSSP